VTLVWLEGVEGEGRALDVPEDWLARGVIDVPRRPGLVSFVTYDYEQPPPLPAVDRYVKTSRTRLLVEHDVELRRGDVWAGVSCIEACVFELA
jgi:hypothetical protein